MDFYNLLNFSVLFLNICVFITILVWAYKTKKKFDRLNQRKGQVWEKAKQQADKIIEEAVEKGEEILEESVQFKNDLTTKTEKLLKETEERNAQMFDKEMTASGQKMATEMKQSFSSSQDLIDKKTQEFLEQAKREVEGYKQKQIASFDDELKAKFSELSLKLLNKCLTLDEHDELVVNSLEKAKKEGLLQFDTP